MGKIKLLYFDFWHIAFIALLLLSGEFLSVLFCFLELPRLNLFEERFVAIAESYILTALNVKCVCYLQLYSISCQAAVDVVIGL